MLLTPNDIAYCFSQLPDDLPQIQVRKAVVLPSREVELTMWILLLHGLCENPQEQYPVRFLLPEGVILELHSLYLDMVDSTVNNSSFRIRGRRLKTINGKAQEVQFEELERLDVIY